MGGLNSGADVADLLAQTKCVESSCRQRRTLTLPSGLRPVATPVLQLYQLFAQFSQIVHHVLFTQPITARDSAVLEVVFQAAFTNDTGEFASAATVWLRMG